MKAATTNSRGAVPGRPRGSIDPSLTPAISRGPLELVSGIPLNHAGCPSTFITVGLLIYYFTPKSQTVHYKHCPDIAVVLRYFLSLLIKIQLYKVQFHV